MFLSQHTLKGLIFTGIKFRGDLISRAKWPRNPRNFITAKILKIDFREIKGIGGGPGSKFKIFSGIAYVIALNI